MNGVLAIVYGIKGGEKRAADGAFANWESLCPCRLRFATWSGTKEVLRTRLH